MRSALITLTTLAVLVGCGSKVADNSLGNGSQRTFFANTPQEFVWQGNCSECSPISQNEWTTTCSGRLVGQTASYRLKEFTTAFRGVSRNACKVPRYQVSKLQSSKVGLTGTPSARIGLKLSAINCSCERPEPHHIKCTPSLALHYLNEQGMQIGEQNLTGFAANRYCLGGEGQPKPCAPEKDEQVHRSCMELSFGLFDALTGQVLYSIVAYPREATLPFLLLQRTL